ncbi:MAG: hypothetical protein KGL39_34330 [Patescibacteria group bacterium]|nr:hypothetical protein [Patescibacteria group bacterium]
MKCERCGCKVNHLFPAFVDTQTAIINERWCSRCVREPYNVAALGYKPESRERVDA